MSVFSRLVVLLAVSGFHLFASAGLVIEDDPLSSSPKQAVKAAAPGVAEAPTVQIQPAQRWEVRLSDGTLSRALLRWAEQADIQLVWEAPKDKPALKALYQGSFDSVVEQLMVDTKYSEYELHACAFDNVVRILHVSQSCKR